jgi:hypothetical protein
MKFGVCVAAKVSDIDLIVADEAKQTPTVERRAPEVPEHPIRIEKPPTACDCPGSAE